MVAVASSDATFHYLREQSKWPQTEEEELEEDDLHRRRTCFYCGEKYREADNTDDRACHYHGDVLDLAGPSPRIIYVNSNSSSKGGGVTGPPQQQQEALLTRGLPTIYHVAWTNNVPFNEPYGLNPELYSHAQRIESIRGALERWRDQPWKRKDAFYTCCNGAMTSPGCREGRHSDRSRQGPLIVSRSLVSQRLTSFAESFIESLHQAGRGDLMVVSADLVWALRELDQHEQTAFRTGGDRPAEETRRIEIPEFLQLVQQVQKTLRAKHGRAMDSEACTHDFHCYVEAAVAFRNQAPTDSMHDVWLLVQKVAKSIPESATRGQQESLLKKRAVDLARLWFEFAKVYQSGALQPTVFMKATAIAHHLAEREYDYRGARQGMLLSLRDCTTFQLQYSRGQLGKMPIEDLQDLAQACLGEFPIPARDKARMIAMLAKCDRLRVNP